MCNQLYVVRSGGCVNFQLVELLRTSDASQIKADALRAEGQALLDETRAKPCWLCMFLVRWRIEVMREEEEEGREGE